MTAIHHKVLIVGAGIAGCSAAIALADQGMHVTLVEKQAEWRFQSSGIFIYSNGLEALRRVGVLPQHPRSGLRHRGRPQRLPRPPRRAHRRCLLSRARSGGAVPVLGIKRAEMHRILAGRLGALGVDIRLATTVAAIHSPAGSDHAEVTLSDGSAQRFDLVVGADGIRSQVREAVSGPARAALHRLRRLAQRARRGRARWTRRS
jgi:2-polyprenyl-6-methoxyphenol hydroxylase-like FAD-dependent oxidoreductase